MSENKKELAAIIISALLLIAGFFIKIEYLSLALYISAYLIVGVPIILEAAKGIIELKSPDECFLMTVATLGAFVLKEYPEAVFVMLFYRVGEFFEDIASQKSRDSITELTKLKPEKATLAESGKVILPEEIKVGDILIISPGDRIPVDGIVVSGSATLDTSFLTGESLPREAKEGSKILSGCINLDGVLKMRADSVYGESTAARILKLIEESSDVKSKSEKFITRFAKVYTPVIVLIALLVALVPPLFTKEWISGIYRGLIMLVISCPCALVLSVPLTFFSGLGCAGKNGILIKGSEHLESLSKIKKFYFDKTGTLTKGKFSVQGCEGDQYALFLAAACEHYSTHPIAQDIKKLYPDIIPQNIHEHTGFGIEAEVDGAKVLCGNEKLMNKFGIEYTKSETHGTHVYVAKDGVFCGCITVSDSLKDTSKSAINKLQKDNIEVFMLTGDSEIASKMIAKELNIEKYHAGLLPEDKMKLLENNGARCAFVGDGINDAPALMRADVGIAMGAYGSGAATESADIVLMNDDPESIVKAIKISKKTRCIVKENIVFALAVKLAVILLGTFGIANMSAAVFADVGVLVLSVLNSMRAQIL